MAHTGRGRGIKRHERERGRRGRGVGGGCLEGIAFTGKHGGCRCHWGNMEGIYASGRNVDGIDISGGT